MSETVRAIAVAAGAMAVALGWMAGRALSLAPASPQRLVAELRLAQVGALVLTFVAAVYWGFAILQPTRPGVAFDVALASGFFVAAAVAPQLDPRLALGMLAALFVAHAMLDVLHRPGAVLDGIVPQWYALSCAVYDVAIGVCCYLPIFKR